MTTTEPAARPAAVLDLMGSAPSAAAIVAACDDLALMLLTKNRRYGDSALDPVRIASRAPVDEQLRVRIDDKLSRLRTSAPGDDEDALWDLAGYLVLLRIATRGQAAGAGDEEPVAFDAWAADQATAQRDGLAVVKLTQDLQLGDLA